MEPLTVDLQKYTDVGVGVLAGRPRGEGVRRQVGLDKADKDKRRVVVIIPPWVFSVNSSFSLGLLENSVVDLGADEFRARYEFRGPNADAVKEDVIAKSLVVGSPLRGMGTRR